MFKIKDNPTFKWRVEYYVPVDFRHEKVVLTVTYRRFKSKQIAEMMKPVLDSGFSLDAAALFCDQICAGFEVDEDGHDQDTLRDELLSEMPVVKALIIGYNDAMNGVEVKNSETPPAALSG